MATSRESDLKAVEDDAGPEPRVTAVVAALRELRWVRGGDMDVRENAVKGKAGSGGKILYVAPILVDYDRRCVVGPRWTTFYRKPFSGCVEDFTSVPTANVAEVRRLAGKAGGGK